MHTAHTLREPQIPLPHDPATAGRQPTPEFEIRTLAALRRLVWLSLYVAFMRLLGYRIARDPAPRTARPAQTEPAAPPPPAPAHPRRKHRYLDRAMCLNMLSGISQAFPPASPIPAPPIPAPATLARAPARRQTRPPPARPRASALIPSPQPARPPHHTPDLQNPDNPATPTHDHFVTIS